MREQIHGTEDSQYGDISEQVCEIWYTGVLPNEKKHYGQKCMQDIEKMYQASWFSRRGNIESHKTESGFNNQVVVANVLNMYVKNVNKQ